MSRLHEYTQDFALAVTAAGLSSILIGLLYAAPWLGPREAEVGAWGLFSIVFGGVLIATSLETPGLATYALAQYVSVLRARDVAGYADQPLDSRGSNYRQRRAPRYGHPRILRSCARRRHCNRIACVWSRPSP